MSGARPPTRSAATPRSSSTDAARDLVPPLPFPEIDVLIIEQGGKDISGTTIDPNVTGRFWVHGLADLESPRVSTIVLLGITEVSGGNVLGIGFADFIPASVAAGIDWQKTYVNCFTAGIAGVRRSRMPMVLPTEDDCIKAALSMCGKAVDEPKHVVRIRSTLHLTRCWVSEPSGQLPPGADRRLALSRSSHGARRSSRTRNAPYDRRPILRERRAAAESPDDVPARWEGVTAGVTGGQGRVDSAASSRPVLARSQRASATSAEPWSGLRSITHTT